MHSALVTAAKHPFFSDCHLVSQYEYVWDQFRNRDCSFVLKYEDVDLYENINELLSAYPLTTKYSNFSSSSAREHQQHSLQRARESLSPSVLEKIRAFYWKDSCLFGYDLSASPSTNVALPHYSNRDDNCASSEVVSGSDSQYKNSSQGVTQRLGALDSVNRSGIDVLADMSVANSGSIDLMYIHNSVLVHVSWSLLFVLILMVLFNTH